MDAQRHVDIMRWCYYRAGITFVSAELDKLRPAPNAARKDICQQWKNNRRTKNLL